MSFNKIQNIRDVRKKLGLNQIEFWNKIGVTQSGGSRYESGRNMPKPVRELVRIVHIDQVDIEKLNKIDLDIIQNIKENHPDIYSKMKTEIEQKK